MLRKGFLKLEKKLLAEIKSFYKERLISVVLFGSVARGTPNFHSDLDVLIIAKNLPRGRIKRIREFAIIENACAELLNSLKKKGINTDISAFIKTPEEAERGSPLFIDMVQDARILFDRHKFFSKIIKRLKERLDILGAKRIWCGSAWYWVLKPDYRPGEVFEL